MVQKRNEISEFRDRIGEYYKNIGEQMNFTYVRLNKVEAAVNAILKEIAAMKETTKVDRQEFRDTTATLVESLKGLAMVTVDIPKVLTADEEEEIIEV